MNSWGILGKPTPEKVEQWKNLPYGKFKEMVADVKKQTKGKPLQRYAVEVKEIEESSKTAFVTVEAATSDQAIKLAQLAEKDTLNWSEPKKEKYNKYSYRVSQVWD
jgi:NADH:ubiquinone oxidoreductase subunit D